ncbi:hypothetical protein [Streptomyces subrutilus]|uniref:Uncharacterized protein n=1 Tax=Streptomyces subrutilus TaxID=36818 RepID=A0A918V859_9ACTN|nr:hypothetical protein [Streptomyces subrutilus]WSJ29470.1 hypothetical protein OG479_09195 [Streptomyces subrutilus]GGZ79167.1 hypothetical protein GCM10010371_43430 [Streptomyces subrutilus]
MSAPTHTRPLPAAPHSRPLPPRIASARPRASRTGADARLHWWALALPALAFGLLLLLLAGSGEARAASGEGAGPGLVQVAEQLLRAVG